MAGTRDFHKLQAFSFPAEYICELSLHCQILFPGVLIVD